MIILMKITSTTGRKMRTRGERVKLKCESERARREREREIDRKRGSARAIKNEILRLMEMISGRSREKNEQSEREQEERKSEESMETRESRTFAYAMWMVDVMFIVLVHCEMCFPFSQLARAGASPLREALVKKEKFFVERQQFT
jgi:hypothetical protein